MNKQHLWNVLKRFAVLVAVDVFALLISNISVNSSLIVAATVLTPLVVYIVKPLEGQVHKTVPLVIGGVCFVGQLLLMYYIGNH